MSRMKVEILFSELDKARDNGPRYSNAQREKIVRIIRKMNRELNYGVDPAPQRDRLSTIVD